MEQAMEMAVELEESNGSKNFKDVCVALQGMEEEEEEEAAKAAEEEEEAKKKHKPNSKVSRIADEEEEETGGSGDKEEPAATPDSDSDESSISSMSEDEEEKKGKSKKKAKGGGGEGNAKKRRKSTDTEDDDNAGKIKVKRPPTSYILFSQTFNPNFRKENPNSKLPDVSTACGAAWKALSEEDKKIFQDEALVFKSKYEEEVASLRASGTYLEPSQGKAKKAKTEGPKKDRIVKPQGPATAENVNSLVRTLEKHAGVGDGAGELPNPAEAVKTMHVLADAYITNEIMSATGLGKKVKNLKSHPDQMIQRMAQQLLTKLKARAQSQIASTKKPAAEGGDYSSKSSSKPSSEPEPQPNAAYTGAALSVDTVRQKCRGLIVAQLKIDGADVELVGQRAAEVEVAMWEVCTEDVEQYKEMVKKLIAPNLKRNKVLRDKVLSGAISATDLVRMTPDAMKTAESLKIEEELALESFKDRMTADSTTISHESDEFQCGKCKAKKVSYYQKQTRSADEPMTTFITCLACRHQWREC